MFNGYRYSIGSTEWRALAAHNGRNGSEVTSHFDFDEAEAISNNTTVGTTLMIKDISNKYRQLFDFYSMQE